MDNNNNLVWDSSITKQTLQENMDGLDNITKIQQRISAEKAETVLFESLMAQAAEGNPKATMAAIEIRKNPQKMSEILDKFYTAEGDEPSEQELAMLGMGGPQIPAGPGGGLPGLEQVLGSLGQGGPSAG